MKQQFFARLAALALALLAGSAQADSPAPGREIGAGDSVSDKDKPARAAVAVQHLKDVVKRMEKLREEARQSNDVVKLNCVNEKLSQARGLSRVGAESEAAMQDALARGDADISGHELTKISRASAKVEQLRAQSESCVGELSVYNGETVVRVEGDKPGDPTVLPPPDSLPDRPIPASNYE